MPTSRRPKPRISIPAGISLGFASCLLGLRRGGASHALYRLAEDVLVTAGASLARRVHELLALAAFVGLRLLSLGHGANVADLCAPSEVRHG